MATVWIMFYIVIYRVVSGKNNRSIANILAPWRARTSLTRWQTRMANGMQY